MADVTYFVAMPFVAADDGAAPGEAVECTSASAAIMKAELAGLVEILHRADAAFARAFLGERA